MLDHPAIIQTEPDTASAALGDSVESKEKTKEEHMKEQVQALRELLLQLDDLKNQVIIIIESIEPIQPPVNIDNARKAKADYMREYMRNWSKNNPDKVKASQKRYWARKHDRDKQGG